MPLRSSSAAPVPTMRRDPPVAPVVFTGCLQKNVCTRVPDYARGSYPAAARWTTLSIRPLDAKNAAALLISTRAVVGYSSIRAASDLSSPISCSYASRSPDDARLRQPEGACGDLETHSRVLTRCAKIMRKLAHVSSTRSCDLLRRRSLARLAPVTCVPCRFDESFPLLDFNPEWRG